MPTSPAQPESLIRDDLYVRNMAALFRADAGLAQRIDACEPDGSVVVVEAGKRTVPTATVHLPGQSRPTQLHSRYDPENEAKQLIDKVEIGESFCYLVSGFGLGYHVRELFRRLKGDAFIVVTEPNLQILKKALETVDLADLFHKDRCIILTEADKGKMQARLERYNNLMMIGTQSIAHPASDRIDSEFQARMRRLIADHMVYCRMCLTTLVKNSRITSRNVANNLPRYVSTPSIAMLRDRFKSCPAVVVAAGPSLRRNIDQLAGLKGKAVIIAVQTTYKMLLERGIEPDFVTSLDYHEMSRRFFEGIDDFGHTHLVAEPKVTWHVLDTFRGKASLLGNDFAELLVGSALGHKPGLKAGATVAHLAFYLAVHLGCDPIVLLGQDLGYSDHVYYMPGVAFHQLWQPDLNRFCTIEMKEWERIVRHRPILMKVKDIHGHDIYTDQQLFTYLQQFEGDFSTTPRQVIDATEGGVRKSNTTIMSLKQVADQFCREAIPADKFAYRDELKWDETARLPLAMDQLTDRIAETDRLAEICRKMIAILKEMTALLERPEDFNRRFAEVDALRIELRAQDRVYRMVSAVSQHAELQRFTADRQLSLTDLDSRTRARRQLERDIRFVEAIQEGCAALRDIITTARDRCEKAIAQGGAA